MRTLWDMLDTSVGARRDGDAEVLHEGFVLQDVSGLLRQLIAEKDMSSSRIVNGRRMKREERLRLAATLSLQLGDLKQHCELLVSLDEWLAALAMAPGVSLEYWRGLCAQYVHALQERNAMPHEITAFLVASGDARGAVHHLVQRDEHVDAQILAQADATALMD